MLSYQAKYSASVALGPTVFGLKKGSEILFDIGWVWKSVRARLEMATAISWSKASVRKRGVMIGSRNGSEELMWTCPRERGVRGQKAAENVLGFRLLSPMNSTMGTVYVLVDKHFTGHQKDGSGHDTHFWTRQ